MKVKIIYFLSLFLSNCAGVSSKNFWSVSIAFDPRSVGTQIDDSIMQKVYQQNFIR